MPERQIDDIRSAIGFLATQPEIAAGRIALWGTSLGGANAIVAASRDVRVKCLSVQLTFANGERVVTGKMSDQEKERFLVTLKHMQDRRAKSGKDRMVPLTNVLTDPQSSTSFVRYQFGIGDHALWFNGELNIDVEVRSRSSRC